MSTTNISQQTELLTTKQVAAQYGIAEGTLRYWRHTDSGPASFSRGKRVVYRRGSIEDWLSAQEAASTRGGVA